MPKLTATIRQLLWLGTLVSAIIFGCVTLAVSIYAILYWLLIPLQITHRQPINFRFDYPNESYHSPVTATALVDFSNQQFSQVLSSWQYYDVNVELIVPDSSYNQQLGNCMIEVALLNVKKPALISPTTANVGVVKSTASSDRIAEFTVNLNDQQSLRDYIADIHVPQPSQPAANTYLTQDEEDKVERRQSRTRVIYRNHHVLMLYQRSWPFRLARMWLRLPWILMEFLDETQTLRLPIIRGLQDNSKYPITHAKVDLYPSAGQPSKPIHFYEALIRIDVHFTGVRYWMFYWFLPTAISFISVLVLTKLIFFVILLWYCFGWKRLISSLYSGSYDDQDENDNDSGELIEIKETKKKITTDQQHKFGFPPIAATIGSASQANDTSYSGGDNSSSGDHDSDNSGNESDNNNSGGESDENDAGKIFAAEIITDTTTSHIDDLSEHSKADDTAATQAVELDNRSAEEDFHSIIQAAASQGAREIPEIILDPHSSASEDEADFRSRMTATSNTITTNTTMDTVQESETHSSSIDDEFSETALLHSSTRSSSSPAGMAVVTSSPSRFSPDSMLRLRQQQLKQSPNKAYQTTRE